MTSKTLIRIILLATIILASSILEANPAPRSTECEVGTTYVSGHITVPSTVWDTSGSPYVITDDVYVDSSCTLRIEPGVDVLFSRPGDLHSIFVDGYLLAVGTETDSITISYDTLINESSPQWGSIKFNNSVDSISVLKYCRISYGYWCIICDEGSQKIINNYIYVQPVYITTLIGIYCWNNSIPIIRNNNFRGCRGFAIALENYSNALIKSNNFNIIGTGIQLDDHTSAIIDSNVFENLYQGIAIYNSSPDCEIKIRWNVFENISSKAIYNSYYTHVDIHDNVINKVNESAIGVVYFEGSCDIKNNIIKDIREYSVAILEYQSLDIVKRNCFDDSANFRIEPEGSIPNLGLINMVNENSDSCDIYYNLFTDPLFSDTINYYLSDSSPCINAGDPSLPWDPDSTPPDIGVHYYDTTTWIFEPDIKKPEKLELFCYPNPFNDAISIEIAFSSFSNNFNNSELEKLHATGNFKLEFFDINGRMVGCGELLTPYCLLPTKYTWTPHKSIGSGIYFIKATIGNKSIAKQVVYLK